MLEDLSETELEQIKSAFATLAGTVGADLDAAREDLQDAKEGFEEVQSVIDRAKAVSVSRVPS